MDLTRSLASRPVARQFRKSLLAYMNSSAFEPEIEIEPKYIGTLIDPKVGIEKENNNRS